MTARFYHCSRNGRHTFQAGFTMEPILLLPKTFPTTAGLRLAFHPAPLVIPRDPDAALLFAAHMDRRADAALIENRPDVADRFAHAAYEARRRAEGVRP